MRIIIRTVVGVVGILLAYLALWPTGIDPIAFDVPADPGPTGVFKPDTRLNEARLIDLQGGHGPEDVTLGPNGLLYTGLMDGRIVRFAASGEGDIETVANTGGRPLGLQFDATGNLIVADSMKGLLSISPQGEVRVLADHLNGERMIFVDDLDIAADGTIWFSDASQNFDLHGNILDLMEGRPSGRLISYEPATKELTVHLEDLAFANGVALGPDEEFVLVNETFRFRIKRLWLKGERAGEVDYFIEGLPGYPDNLSFNGRDTFWVALVSPRQELIESVNGKPFMRQVMVRLSKLVGGEAAGAKEVGWVLGLSVEGAVTASMQAPEGHHAVITSVNEFDGHLVLGSLTRPEAGILPLD